MPQGNDPRLSGVAGGEGVEDHELIVVIDNTAGQTQLFIDDVAVETSACPVVMFTGDPASSLLFLRHHGRSDDLRMGVLYGGSGTLAVVLEDNHVLRRHTRLESQVPLLVRLD